MVEDRLLQSCPS